jgi:tetratricopeptide (TPR) repeat protein
VSTDPVVNEIYARALGLELQGKYAEARKLFQVAAAQEPELFFLRYEIALCTRDLREWVSAETQFDALYQEALAGDDTRALIVTLNALGIMHFIRNNYDAAEPRFAEALRVARGNRYAADRASIHVNLALIAMRRGDARLARRHYDLALDSFAQAGQEPSPSFDNNYAGLLLDLGDLEAAQRYSEKAVEGFRLRGQRQYEAPALIRLAEIRRQRGDMESAITDHEQAMLIYREIDDAVGEVSVMTSMTAIYREQGDFTRARLNAREVMSRSAALGDELLLADAHMQLGYISGDFGLFDEAQTDFGKAREIFEKLGDATRLREADEAIALTALALGDTARALTIAQLLLETARTAEIPANEARAQWLLGRIALAGGNVKAAVAHYMVALDFARSTANEALLADAALSLARLYLDSDNVDGARVLIDDIRKVAKDRRDFLRLDARLAAALGDTGKARSILTDLRSRIGEAWTAEDEAMLEEFSVAADSP